MTSTLAAHRHADHNDLTLAQIAPASTALSTGNSANKTFGACLRPGKHWEALRTFRLRCEHAPLVMLSSTAKRKATTTLPKSIIAELQQLLSGESAQSQQKKLGPGYRSTKLLRLCCRRGAPYALPISQSKYWRLVRLSLGAGRVCAVYSQ